MQFYWSLRRIRQYLADKYTHRKKLPALPAHVVLSKKEAEKILETKTPDELREFIARLEYNGFPVKEEGEQLNFCSSFIAS